MQAQAIRPVLTTKSVNVYPKDVPIMMLGGSPDMVALPPMLDANISAIMTGTGSNLSKRAISTETVARKSITVMLSMNMERNPERSMKVTRMGITL